jgi:hypothetical protein
MKTWTTRLGLSLMVVVGFWTSRASAQEVLVVPEIPYAPSHHPDTGLPFGPRPQPTPANHWMVRCANNHGVFCEADPYTIAASSLRYELKFIWGSSRWFLAQPCPPGHVCQYKRTQP